MPRVGPTPGPVRVGKVDLDAVNGVSFVFPFSLQDKLFENSIGAGDNTAKKGLA